MLERFDALKDALGSYKAVAEYLGYSDRHFLNIRKSLEHGQPLKKRVELYISGMIDLIDHQRPSETEIEHGESEQPEQG